MQILQLLLAGTVGAALVKLVDNVIQFLLNRAAKKSDRNDAEIVSTFNAEIRGPSWRR